MVKNTFYALFVALAVLSADSAIAAPVDVQQARMAAMAFLNENSTTSKMLRGGSAGLELAYTANNKEYYAFNASGAEGYVLVAGDDRMPAVIGYSDEGEFNPNDMPENMRDWLEGYAQQVRYLQLHKDARIASSTQYTAGNVYPLLGNTKWNQSAPYNNMCPTYTKNGSTYRAVTGCVATAMAQVMYYHRWPEVGTGSNTYTFNLNGDSQQSKTLSTDFSKSHYDWANMLPVYNGVETTAQNNAVAKLMNDCGVAMNMNYGASSGAVTRIAMNKMAVHFGYDKSIKFIPRDAYSLDKWLKIINGELANKRPVIHSGRSDKGGHAFVVDGCDPNGYYHLNWGWAGLSNGYFVLTDLTPTDQGIGSSEGGYNQSQGLIYNIMPDQGGAVGHAAHIEEFLTNSSRVTLGSQASLSWKSYYVIWTGNGDAAARIALGITDEADNLKQVASTAELAGFSPNYNYSRNWSMTVPSNLAAGTYYIVPLIAPSGTSNYQRVDVNRSSVDRIKMEVKNGYAYFSYPDNAAKLSVVGYEHSDVLAANRAINVKATVANSGVEFVDNLRIALLNADGSVAAASVPKRVDVQNGEEAVLETTVMPTRAGNYKLSVVYADSTLVGGAQKALTIGAAPAAINLAIANQLELAKTVLPTTHLEGRATIYNSGGAFAGRIEAMIMPTNTSSIIYRIFSDFITIQKGERKEVKLVGAFTRGEIGEQYRIVLRNPKYTTSNTSWGNYITFTLGVPTPRDVNVDGAVDVSDVTALISAILGEDVYPFNSSEADTDGNGEVNVSDVTALINHLLGM